MNAGATAILATPTARLVLPAGASEDEWHAARSLGLGGSDIAAMLGMDRYRTPRHVWLEKRGELPDMPRSSELNRAAAWGHRLEEFVAQAWAEEAKQFVTPGPGTLAHIDREWMRANVDRLIHESIDGPAIGLLECKNRSAYQAADWANDTPPDSPALQAHWYMAVTGYQVAHVAALIGGNQLVSFRLDRDDELIDHLTELADAFWATVLDEEAPAPPIGSSAAATDLLAHLWETTANSMVVLDPDTVIPLLAQREELKGRIKECETELAGVENQIKDMLGEHEIGVDPTYRQLVTWKRNGQFSARQFSDAHPDIAADHLTAVTVLDSKAVHSAHPDLHRQHRARVLRVPKGAI